MLDKVDVLAGVGIENENGTSSGSNPRGSIILINNINIFN